MSLEVPNSLKVAIPALAVGTAIGIFGGLELPSWLAKMAEQWGPGFAMVLGVFAGFAYYVPRNVVKQFVDAQISQAVAMTDISRSLQEISGQSGKIDEIKNLLEDTLINQRVMMRQLGQIQGHPDG